GEWGVLFASSRLSGGDDGEGRPPRAARCRAVLFGYRIGQAGRLIMPRRPAQITQADVARIIRAAKQAGASEVVVKIGEQSVIVKLSTAPTINLEADGEVIL